MTITLNGTTGITLPNGSASTPAETGTDTDSGVFYGTNTVSIATGGATAVTVDSSQNVGIGTSSPSSMLHVSGAGLFGSASSSTNFLGFNRSSAGTILNSSIGAGNIYNSGSTFSVECYNSAGTVKAQVTLDTSGNTRINNPSGESARFDSSGNLLVGTTSNPTTLNGTGRINVLSTGDGFNIKQEGGGGGNHVFNVWSIGTTSNNAMAFYKGNTQTLVGSISTSTSSTAYNTSSDYRLKENIAPMTGALSVVSALKPVTYTWKADGSDGQGFIAHELQAVVPDCVTGEKDAVDEEGNPVYQGIDTSFLVATLTAAIQELKTELDTVKTELATLKGTA